MFLCSVSDYLMGDQDGSQNLTQNQSEIGHVSVSRKIVFIVAFKVIVDNTKSLHKLRSPLMPFLQMQMMHYSLSNI